LKLETGEFLNTQYPIPGIPRASAKYLVRNYSGLGEKEQKMRPSPDTLELDPQKIAERKEKAGYRLNVIQFPVLRLLGFALISFFILVHNYYVFKVFFWAPFLQFSSIAFSYSLFSWAILYLFFGKNREIRFRDTFSDYRYLHLCFGHLLYRSIQKPPILFVDYSGC